MPRLDSRRHERGREQEPIPPCRRAPLGVVGATPVLPRAGSRSRRARSTNNPEFGGPDRALPAPTGFRGVRPSRLFILEGRAHKNLLDVFCHQCLGASSCRVRLLLGVASGRPRADVGGERRSGGAARDARRRRGWGAQQRRGGQRVRRGARQGGVRRGRARGAWPVRASVVRVTSERVSLPDRLSDQPTRHPRGRRPVHHRWTWPRCPRVA